MTEFVEAILAQIIGNISTALIVVIFYFNFLLFESYLRLIVWAILFSQALRQAKNNVVSVLQYLSDDPDVDKHGFLTCVFSKSFEIVFRHPHGKTRSPKELFLNYGVFIFSMIGGVSIWMRVFSWMLFVRFSLGFCLIALGLIKLLDRRIFCYRYFISDEVLVSTVLILGFFTTGIFVIVYLGTESYLEGSRAASDLTGWVQKNFVNDERTRQLWSEQVENSRTMITSALHGFENTYNDTMWWPPLKSLVKTYYLDGNNKNSSSSSSSYGNMNSMMSTGDQSSSADPNGIANDLYTKLSLPANMTLIQALSMAYAKVDSVNLTSVQLTDWTSKGLEVSSIMFGSVAQLVFFVFTFLIAFVSLGIRAFFFISSLFYLLCTQWDPIERFVEDLLPIQVEKRPHVVRSLRRVIEGVFFLPLKMSSLHSIVTLVSLNAVNADFIYLATTLTFIISIVPIIPPYLVCLPWVLSIWITTSFVKAICLFAVHYILFTFFDDALYEKSIGALNSYISALSVVFGVYVFGIEGVIFGPLSVCGVYFAYEVSNHGIQAAAQDDYYRDGRTSMATTPNVSPNKPKLQVEIEEIEEEEDRTQTRDRDGRSTSRESEEMIEQAPTSSNIFSSAYRVISGGDNRFGFQPLADRMRRRFSIDLTSNDAVCVTFVIDHTMAHSHHGNVYHHHHHHHHQQQQQQQQQQQPPRRVRYAINKTWTQKTLLESLSRTLHVYGIQGIYTENGVEILSPSHVFPNEILHVKLRPKKHSMSSTGIGSVIGGATGSNSSSSSSSSSSSNIGGGDGLHTSPSVRHGYHHHHHPYLKAKDRRKTAGNVLHFEGGDDSGEEKMTAPRLCLKRVQSVDPVTKMSPTTAASAPVSRRSSFALVESALRRETGSATGLLSFTTPFPSPITTLDGLTASTPTADPVAMGVNESNHSISFTSSVGSSDLFAVASAPSTPIMMSGKSEDSNLSNPPPQPNQQQSLPASTSSTISTTDETGSSLGKPSITVDPLASVDEPSTNKINVATFVDEKVVDTVNNDPPGSIAQKGIRIHLNPRGGRSSGMRAGFSSSPLAINQKKKLTNDEENVHLSTPKAVGSNGRSHSVSNTLTCNQQSPQLHPHPKSKSVGDLGSIEQEEDNEDELSSKTLVKTKKSKEKRRHFWRRLFGIDKENNFNPI